MEILAIMILAYAIRKAWADSRSGAKKSRAAYMKRADARYPGMPKSKRAAHAARHDLGYGLSQFLRGFPQARHGFGAGWHEGRQAHAIARAEREKAKAGHLETRARLIPDVDGYRKRQRAALDRIRGGATPEEPETPAPEETRAPEEGGEGSPQVTCEHEGVTCSYTHCPCPCPRCGGARMRARDLATYSYGLAGSRSHWPAESRYDAERGAQHSSSEGKRYEVAEYVPGVGPGRIVSAYENAEPVPVVPAGGQGIDDHETEDTRLPQAGPPPAPFAYSVRREGDSYSWLTGDPDDAVAQAREWSHSGNRYQVDQLNGHGGGRPVVAYVNGEPDTSVSPASPTEGNPMTASTASDTTYDGVLRHISNVRDFEEAALSERTDAANKAGNLAEEMQALNVDPDTLGSMADHLDAQEDAKKAQQRVMETAEQVKSALERGHRGLSEAHKDAPVPAAEKPFYDEG